LTDIYVGVSCHSAASEISCDYADPPDENSSKSDSESSEPEQKLLRYATDSQKHVSLNLNWFVGYNCFVCQDGMTTSFCLSTL